jgi:cell wall-associated NlpC family hydrolase
VREVFSSLRPDKRESVGFRSATFWPLLLLNPSSHPRKTMKPTPMHTEVPTLMLTGHRSSPRPRRSVKALASLLALGAGLVLPAIATAEDPTSTTSTTTDTTATTTATDTTTGPSATTNTTPASTTPTPTTTLPAETTTAPSDTPPVTTTASTVTVPAAPTPTPGTPTAPSGTPVTVTGTKTVPTPSGATHRQRPGKSGSRTGGRAKPKKNVARGKGRAHAKKAHAKKAHAKKVHHHQKARAKKPSSGTLTPVGASGGNAWAGPLMIDPFTAAQLHQYAELVGSMVVPPKYLAGIYKSAARHYRLPWQVLAGINFVETRYGGDLAVSSAGAEGWMQFMPATWSTYGMNVNADGTIAPGVGDPWQPRDAIYSAARYLVASGAPHNLAKAILSYNHAGWYVQEVLTVAEAITMHGVHVNSKPKRKLYAMRTEARLLNGMPYVWGGGHDTWYVSDGYDCSGFVSAVLHAGGYLKMPMTTQDLPADPAIKPGPGRLVTIYDRTDQAITSDHVIMRIGKQWWESGGGSADGAPRVHRVWHMDPGYLATFNLVLHPRGM